MGVFNRVRYHYSSDSSTNDLRVLILGNERLSWRLRDVIALTVLAVWGALHLTAVVLDRFMVPPQVDQAMLIILAWWPTSAVVEVAISHRHPRRGTGPSRKIYAEIDPNTDDDERVVMKDESNAAT